VILPVVAVSAYSGCIWEDGDTSNEHSVAVIFMMMRADRASCHSAASSPAPSGASERVRWQHRVRTLDARP
jgi:hypothetical protein